MNIKIKQKTLMEGINTVIKGIGKSTMPVLEGIYINASNGKLTLIGSDMDISIKTTVEVLETIKEGSIVVDAKIFSEIIRKLPDEEVTLNLTEGVLTITCKKIKFEVVVMNPEDYPELKTKKSDIKLKLSGESLKEMAKGVYFAVAQDDTRPLLQGVFFEVIENKLNLVALDGYRMATRTNLIEYDDNCSCIIPVKTLSEVIKIISNSDIEISMNPNHIVFTQGETIISSRLLSGQYVNYKGLFPVEHTTRITIDKNELYSSIERASLMSKDGTSNLIKFSIEDDIIRLTSNSQLGKVKEEIACSTEGNKLEIAFNSRYILEVLRTFPENKVHLELTTSVSPCVIFGDNEESGKYLVLPVRMVK